MSSLGVFEDELRSGGRLGARICFRSREHQLTTTFDLDICDRVLRCKERLSKSPAFHM